MYLGITACIIAYLFGSVNSAIVTCKILGIPDPRTIGSGNPGATNVLRIGGKKAAIITLLGDMLKGLIPVLIAKMLGFSTTILALVALFAFLGHLYPIFFRFQGGKGVATVLGCLLGLAWPVGFAMIITWVVIAFIFRYSSLAALITAIMAPFYTWYFTNETYTLIVAIMSLLLIYRHHQNIRKLFRGEESKIFKK